MAPHAARRPDPAAVSTQGAARRARHGDRTVHHAGMREDPRRGGRRAPARHRERRGRHRHPDADARQQPRGHRVGHRRADDPPAGRHRRRHHAVQLSGDDSAVVPAVRGRLRQRDHHQALRKNADDHGADLRADRSGRFPARHRQPRARRQDGRRRAARSSRRPGDLVRRLDAGRPLRLRPRRGQRQARAMPGRRQEPDRDPARCRHGDDDADCRRLGVRLRRTALPGVVCRHYRRRSVRRPSPARSPRRLRRERSAMASTPASRWGR